MTSAEVIDKFGPIPLRNFTIAGVPSKHSIIRPQFYEDKLDEFIFLFNAQSFEDVQRAVKEKYPLLDCKTSRVTNAMGASFPQVNCRLQDQHGILSLSRFGTDLNTSFLMLRSDRSIKEFSDQRKAKQKDI